MNVIRNDGWLGDFIVLGPARFTMGAADEDRYALAHECPAREETIDYCFAIGVFPVTRDQWDFEAAGKIPKVMVSWNDIAIWLETARAKSGLPLRLPTEGEWEYAARAGSSGGFPGADCLSEVEANFLHDDSKNKVGPGCLTPRGSFPANAYGLEDMLGNVAEWTVDSVVRSAGWDSLPRLLRVSARYPTPPDRRQDNLGFRLAYTLP